jgi:hypothetical protein
LVIIAQHWPSALIVASSLGLHIEVAYINPRFISCISSLIPIETPVHPVDAVFQVSFPSHHVVIVSGSVEFLEKLSHSLGAIPLLIWSFEQSFHGKSFQSWNRRLGTVSAYCRERQLTPVLFPHRLYGGATNASHLIAFSRGIGFDVPYSHPPNVRRTVNHFWNPAAQVHSSVCRLSPPPLAAPASEVLMFESHLRSDGLLNVSCPLVSVIGRSVFKPNKFVTRRLTPGELLRLFDVPMALDEALCAQPWSPSRALPFESAVSPAILASIFRNVWGYVGGVEASAPTPPSVSVAAVAPETPYIPAVELVVEESTSAVADDLIKATTNRLIHSN